MTVGANLLGLLNSNTPFVNLDTGRVTQPWWIFLNNLYNQAGGPQVIGNFSSLTVSGQITSTAATGTAPFVITSTTNVANLNAALLNGATFASPGNIGTGVRGSGAFTTLNANGQITSTVSTGTSPFVVASSTNVANLNAALLNGATFAAPSSIGSITPSTGAFTTLNASGQITSTVSTGTAPFVVASATNIPNLNASSLSGATFASPGAIGGVTPAAGTFTSVTATTGAITPSYPSGIIGNASGSGPTAGSIGEIITANATSIALTTATNVIVASISLSAGIWHVDGNVSFNFAGGATSGSLFTGISTATSLANPAYTYSSYQPPAAVSNQSSVLPPSQMYLLGATTTVYLLAYAVFGAGTMDADGIITAVRVG